MAKVVRAELEPMWRTGAPLYEIALKFNCASQTVQFWAKRWGLGPHPKATRFNATAVNNRERKKITELRRAGKTWREVSAEMGRSIGVCHAAINGRASAPINIDADPSVPQSQILERRARLGAPSRDLTGALMGDPPVGHSALERKNGRS